MNWPKCDAWGIAENAIGLEEAYLQVTVSCGIMKRRVFGKSFQVDVGPMLKKDLDDGVVPAVTGLVKGAPLSVVLQAQTPSQSGPQILKAAS